ncbi:MAG: hypothetical protein EXS08_09745 [Planctomycetes bacterium]|nr:hypothetical protein [Planctomycetota bacterium]
MNELTLLDRLRLHEQGRLSRADAAALEHELDADSALRALAQDFTLTWAATASEPWVLGASRTCFDELDARWRRPRALRRTASAAALLLLAAGTFVAGRWSVLRGAGPLVLAAIELDAPPTSNSRPPDLPPAWADFDPRGANGVRFLSDLDEAAELARAARRPLLVYGSYPGCPLCAALDAKVFSSESVIELAERTVPVRVNLAELSESEQRSFTARGYPFLEMWRDDGRTTHSLARNPDPAIFVESLHDGLEKSDAAGEQPPWEELRGAMRRFLDARGDELGGELAVAEREFRALAADARTPPELATRAEEGLRRLAANARALLLEARATAAGDVDGARRLLELGLERYRDTSYAIDLEAALRRLEHDGRFPELVEADRSAC